MQALMGMDPDKMVIILPTALVAMYLVISLQKALCERKNPKIGLILPGICFIVATILAVRPMFVVDGVEMGTLLSVSLRMWLTFNIPTIAFLFPWYRRYRTDKDDVKFAPKTQPEPDTQDEPGETTDSDVI